MKDRIIDFFDVVAPPDVAIPLVVAYVGLMVRHYARR